MTIWLANAIVNGFVAVFGAAVGSFLNVVVYRIPAGLSVLHPPSRCPRCGRRLSPRDNVPVLGWLWLRGRCRYCRTPIAIRYPLVEATTALIFLGVFWHFGWTWNTLGFWIFASFLLALSLIDWDTQTLPSELTQPLLVAGLIFQGIAGWLATQQLAGVASFTFSGVLGMVLALWLLEIVAFLGEWVLGKQALGDGDPKLMAAIGAWLGWRSMLLAWFLGNILGLIANAPGLVVGRLKFGEKFSFGPYLALGAAIALFYGEILIEAYLKFFVLAQ